MRAADSDSAEKLFLEVDVDRSGGVEAHEQNSRGASPTGTAHYPVPWRRSTSVASGEMNADAACGGMRHPLTFDYQQQFILWCPLSPAPSCGRDAPVSVASIGQDEHFTDFGTQCRLFW